MFQDGIMLSPLSYNGVDASKGYFRITCAGGVSEIRDLISRLGARLHEVRSQKIQVLLSQLQTGVASLKAKGLSADFIAQLSSSIEGVSSNTTHRTSRQLKEVIQRLVGQLQTVDALLPRNQRSDAEIRSVQCVQSVQSLFRSHTARAKLRALKAEKKSDLEAFIESPKGVVGAFKHLLAMDDQPLGPAHKKPQALASRTLFSASIPRQDQQAMQKLLLAMTPETLAALQAQIREGQEASVVQEEFAAAAPSF